MGRNSQKFFIEKTILILRDQFFKKKNQNIKKNFNLFWGGDDRGSIIFILKSIIPNIGDYNINLLIEIIPDLKKFING